MLHCSTRILFRNDNDIVVFIPPYYKSRGIFLTFVSLCSHRSTLYLADFSSHHHAWLYPSLLIFLSSFTRALVPSSGARPWLWITSFFLVRGGSCHCRYPQALQGNTILLFLSAHLHVHSDSSYVRAISLLHIAVGLLRVQQNINHNFNCYDRNPFVWTCFFSPTKL